MYLRSVVFLCVLALAHQKSVRQSGAALAELEEYIAAKKHDINPRYRLHYHVMPPVGWMNDPNGFSYHKGQYHLFYQFYPYDSVWGPMHWGHVSSTNLVDWNELPTALLPDEEQCFSGSAFTDGDKMVLMYTGHIVTQTDPFYNQSQYLAFSDDAVVFNKYEGNPVMPSAPNGSPDFRDPKVWRHGDHWYVIIGSKTTDQRGTVLLYRSLDLINWEFLRVLGESDGSMGYMWECPDFFEIDGKHVLLMSPQGLAVQGDRNKNTFQNGYIIGTFNYETFEFVQEVEFQEMDYGHDVYAAQTILDANGRRVVVAWFNMWEVAHPEAGDGWCGAMTIVREMQLVNNRLIMKPLDEMLSLRDGEVLKGNFAQNQVLELEKTGELIINGDLEKNIEIILEGTEGGDKVLLKWDKESGKVVVDRNGDVRQVEWSPIGSHSWRLFLDASSLELFCGEGEVVFSSRAFPNGNWKVTNQSPQDLNLESYKLKRSVPV